MVAPPASLQPQAAAFNFAGHFVWCGGERGRGSSLQDTLEGQVSPYINTLTCFCRCSMPPASRLRSSHLLAAPQSQYKCTSHTHRHTQCVDQMQCSETAPCQAVLSLFGNPKRNQTWCAVESSKAFTAWAQHTTMVCARHPRNLHSWSSLTICQHPAPLLSGDQKFRTRIHLHITGCMCVLSTSFNLIHQQWT